MTNCIRISGAGPILDASDSIALQNSVIAKLVNQAGQVVIESAAVHPEAFAAFGAVEALRQLPAERQFRLVLHPAFRFWLQGMRRSAAPEHSAHRPELLRSLPGLIWAEHFLAGQMTQPWPVWTDARGGLRCPAAGRYLELGAAYKTAEVSIQPLGGDAAITCRDGLTVLVPRGDLEGTPEDPAPNIENNGYELNLSPRLAGGRVEASTRDPWLRVKLTGTNQRSDGVEFFASDDDLYRDRPDLRSIAGALEEFERYWPDGYEDFTRFTRVIVPLGLSQAAGGRNHAFTISSRQGAIFIGEAPVDATIEMLIHENAHVKLRQIQALDTLLVDPLDDSLRISVPWRPDPRPIPGILEGVFVFSHVAEFECRSLLNGWPAASLERARSRVADLRYAVGCIERHARLTPGGAEFLEVMGEWVRSLGHRMQTA